MLRQITLVAAALSATPSFAASVQKPDLSLPETAAANRDAVKKIFTDSYAAYKEFAWGHDDLAPGNKSFIDSRNGWGSSIVDAMSTMYVMGLNDLLDEAVEYVGTIDFTRSKTNDTVSVFETTIRFIGGMLSAYELRGKTDDILVAKSKEVADKLAFAWTTSGSEIPWGHMNFNTNEPERAVSNIAEAGTLILEWARLSDFTGNSTYKELAENAFRHIAELPAPLPGLAAQGISPTTGEFTNAFVSWGGASDSYFEYLVKYARLYNTEDPIWMDTWLTAVDSSIQNLLRTSTVGDHVYTCQYNGTATDDTKRYRMTSSHLACFHGGNWLYGAALVGNDEIKKAALDLVDGCWNTYAGTKTGLGPEGFAYMTAQSNYTGGSDPTDEQIAFYEEHGFYITSSYYILRPEVLESNFYAWRITGDTKYLDRAADAVQSILKYLPASVAYDGIEDVDDEASAKVNDMESFWFAEVLKYLYLTFDEPQNMSIDDYIFNTEAHPFKAPPATSTYGSGKLVDTGKWAGPSSTEQDAPAVPSKAAGMIMDTLFSF
ncbi:glycoside hydrolase family 47 protein [Cylindrobasidium torrendii FP15055 ss-10]|uniref:alpha-1,2-Mannosidase n=1 Tax=Cylindrobasidium torrendii FP15055 ss-10 TaxID=1314674 RepID=A0A0D7BXI5_9AGAR|nr:glycoside hydrolase family 47 protein [Cylindrobasidium torrendii FP15055 ss-10]